MIMKRALKTRKRISTRTSHVVPHRSTTRARGSLTSQIGRDVVLSAWYGRFREKKRKDTKGKKKKGRDRIGPRNKDAVRDVCVRIRTSEECSGMFQERSPCSIPVEASEEAFENVEGTFRMPESFGSFRGMFRNVPGTFRMSDSCGSFRGSFRGMFRNVPGTFRMLDSCGGSFRGTVPGQHTDFRWDRSAHVGSAPPPTHYCSMGARRHPFPVAHT